MAPTFVIATERDGASVGAAHDIRMLDDVLARAPATERMSASLADAVAGLAVVLRVDPVVALRVD